MKRIAALFLTLFLLTFCLVPFSASAAEFTQEEAEKWGYAYPSPVTVFHELWDVPWGASPEEFLDKARQLYGISFQVYDDDDYGIAYDSSDEAAVYLFNYPFRIRPLFLGGADAKRTLADIVIYFPVNTPVSMVAAWLMADDVFYELCTQYGEPWAAYAGYKGRYDSQYFELPMAGKRLDIPKLVEKGDNGLYIEACFDNIQFCFDPKNIASTRYTCLSLSMYSPVFKHISDYLAPANLQPFEDYHPAAPTPTSTPTPLPTPTPAKRIDIGL